MASNSHPLTPIGAHFAARDVAAAILGLSVRRFHELVQDGTLPPPVRRGVYDLRGCIQARKLASRGVVELPTFADAFTKLLETRDELDELLRRHPERCPASAIESGGSLGLLLPPLVTDRRPSRPMDLDDIHDVPGDLVAEMLGISVEGFQALIESGVLPRAL